MKVWFPDEHFLFCTGNQNEIWLCSFSFNAYRSSSAVYQYMLGYAPPPEPLSETLSFEQYSLHQRAFYLSKIVK